MISQSQSSSMSQQLCIQQCELDKVALAIIQQFQNFFGNIAQSKATTLSQKCIILMLAKADQLQLHKKVCNKEVENLKLELSSYQNQSKIDEEPLIKQSRIVNKLIKQKNQIILKKQFIVHKYDKLLAMVKKLRQDQNQWKTQKKTFQQERQELQKVQATKDLQRKELTQQLGKIKEKVKQSQDHMNKLKDVVQDMKKIVIKQLNDIKKNYQLGLEKIQQEYQSEILQYKSLLKKKQQNQFQNQQNIDQLRRDKQQIILELSQISNYKKKQGENDDEWWNLYRKQKEKQIKQKKNKIIPSHCGYSEYDKFKEETKSYLQKIRERNL